MSGIIMAFSRAISQMKLSVGYRPPATFWNKSISSNTHIKCSAVVVKSTISMFQFQIPAVHPFSPIDNFDSFFRCLMFAQSLCKTNQWWMRCPFSDRSTLFSDAKKEAKWTKIRRPEWHDGPHKCHPLYFYTTLSLWVFPNIFSSKFLTKNVCASHSILAGDHLVRSCVFPTCVSSVRRTPHTPRQIVCQKIQ